MEVTVKDILKMLADRFALRRDHLKDRIHLQKAIYLLQISGVRLGYGFSWYNYGPYSQELVYDAYDVLTSENEQYTEKTRSLKFHPDSEAKLAKFTEILGNNLTNPEFLELVASVDFVCKTWYPDADDDSIVSTFKDFKTCYFDGNAINDTDILKAFETSKQLRKVA